MRKIAIDEVRQAVRGVIQEVQQAGGHPTTDLEPTACPVGGIEGFDSLVSLEATVMLEQRLGVSLPNDTMFIQAGRPSSLEEIVQRVATACGAKS